MFALLLFLLPTVLSLDVAANASPPPDSTTHRWRWIGSGTGYITYAPGIDRERSDAGTCFISLDGTIRYGRPAPAASTAPEGPGDEWRVLAPPRGFTPHRLAVSRENVLYVVGQHQAARRWTVLRRKAGADAAWQELPVPCLGMLYGISLQPDGTVWVSGERREVFILRGDSWTKELTPLPYHNFSLDMFDDDTGWIVAETKSVSAIFYRSQGQWTTIARKPGDWSLLYANRDTACVFTREGLLQVPRPELGEPGLFPHLLPFEGGAVALSGPQEGWLLEGGALFRFQGGRRHLIRLESTVYRIRNITAPGDGRLYASDGAGGLYVLEESPPTPATAPFEFRPIRHSSWTNSPSLKGISVLRMKGEELLYCVDHENQNPTLHLDFRIESQDPLDPFAWRLFAESLGNDGPDRTSEWRYPYDMAAITADLNGDGFEDIVLAGLYMGCRLYRNVRDRHFVDWTDESGLVSEFIDHSVGAVALDADSDGDLDLFVGNFMVSNRLYLNNGAGNFREVTEAAGLRTSDSCGMPSAADLDDDGDQDLVVSTWGRGLLLHENIGVTTQVPTFRTAVLLADVPDGPQGSALALDFFNAVGIADLDGDGLEDLVVTSQTGPPRLLRNLGGMQFAEGELVLDDSGSPAKTVGVSFGDFDHDGDLDFVLTGPATGRFFENRGDRMSPVTFGSPHADSVRVTTTGSAVLDFDGDGDLDLVLGSDRAEALFLQNGVDDSRSLLLEVDGPPANRSAIGTRAELYVSGRAGDPDALLQVRRIAGATAYGSSDSKLVHFGGLDPGEVVDVVLELPGARATTVRGLTAPGRHRVSLEADGPVPLATAALFPVGNFFRDRWNRYWLLTVGAMTLIGLALHRMLFSREARPRWPLGTLALLPIAALTFYSTLQVDPGPLPVALSAGIPFVGAAAALIYARSRAQAASIPDLVLSLSDSLRSFRHNETPRRSLDSLRLTLNNVPDNLEDTWCRLLAEDLQAYERVVAPHLRVMTRMARSAELPGADCEAALRRQRRDLPWLVTAISAGRPSVRLEPSLRNRLERFGASLALIHDWLRRMRVETDRRLALDLGELLDRYVRSRRRTAAVTIQLQEQPPVGARVRFRGEDLEHVLDVLFDNAAAAMANSREKLVSLRARIDSPGTASILFLDSGHGIAPSLRARVFERGVTGTGLAGRGMGLHYARRIVERYGGRIDLVDGPDAGACFGIELEVVPGPGSEAPA